MTRTRAVLATATVTATIALAGCSSSAPRVSGTGVPRHATLEPAGPWVDEFQAALDDGVSEFEGQILADGAVTAEEMAAAHDRVGRCLADSGLAIDYDPDGAFGVESLDGEYPDDFFERSDPVLRSCEKESDEYVTYLFEQTRRNPERRDDAEITVPCLQAAGLVGEDYTDQQWRDDHDADTFPFDSMSESARQCDLDPLGLWRTP